MKEAPIKVNNDNKKQLQEKLSWAGKIFFSGAAAYIMGKGVQKTKLPIKVRGNKKQMQAVIDAIMGSKAFQREINKPGATIDDVVDKLQLRNMNKQKFEKLTGKKWPI